MATYFFPNWFMQFLVTTIPLTFGKGHHVLVIQLREVCYKELLHKKCQVMVLESTIGTDLSCSVGREVGFVTVWSMKHALSD